MLGRSSSVRLPAMPVLDELPKFISQVALAWAVSAEGLKGVEKQAASRAVLGWNPPCNGLCCASLRCTLHLPETAFFPEEEKKLIQLCKHAI